MTTTKPYNRKDDQDELRRAEQEFEAQYTRPILLSNQSVGSGANTIVNGPTGDFRLETEPVQLRLDFERSRERK